MLELFAEAAASDPYAYLWSGANSLGLAGFAWYMLVKWIPKEREEAREERDRTQKQFATMLNSQQKLFEDQLEKLQISFEGNLSTQREHNKEILVLVVKEVSESQRRLETRINEILISSEK